MKKLTLFISSLIFFLGAFLVFGLDSFADSYNFPTSYCSFQRSVGGEMKDFTYRCLTQHCCVYKDNTTYFFATESYILNLDTSESASNMITYIYDGEQQTDRYYGVVYLGSTQYVTNLSGAVVFNSLASAQAYLNSGDEDGIISGGDLISPSINWGGNSPEGGSSNFSPDTDNIPAPTFVIDTSNGNNHSIKFTNQIYNYSDHGVYGIVLKCSWLGFDDFSLSKTGNVMWNTDWKVYYNTTLDTSPIVTMFDVPTNENDIVRTPATINFNTQASSVRAFGDFISLYPVRDRTVNYTLAGDQGELLYEFQDYLGEISCPYNTCVFSCYYYRKMSDGTFHYGPITTSHFDVPAQGAVYKRGQSVLDPNPGVTPDDPNYNPGVNPGGTVTPGGIPTGEEVDPSTLYNNMKGLFGFIGELPQLMAGLFQFLPEWVIVFIAVSIGLLVAIGVVKLFVG